MTPRQQRSTSKTQNDEVGQILASIREKGNPNACSIRVALSKLPPSAQEAFVIAMKATQYEYPHVSIKKKLEEMSGCKVGREAVQKHRKHLNGESGGCSCAGN